MCFSLSGTELRDTQNFLVTTARVSTPTAVMMTYNAVTPVSTCPQQTAVAMQQQLLHLRSLTNFLNEIVNFLESLHA